MSRKGHVPIRMCAGCRKRRKKVEMLRFIRTPGEGPLVLDQKGGTGRGLYLCPGDACIKAAKKRYRLERVEADCKMKNEKMEQEPSKLL